MVVRGFWVSRWVVFSLYFIYLLLFFGGGLLGIKVEGTGLPCLWFLRHSINRATPTRLLDVGVRVQPSTLNPTKPLNAN